MFIFGDIMLNYLRYLLLPFSLLYRFVIILRNKAFDWGLLKSVKFDFPIIVIGNLAVGGTGKSPMTEYLIRMLGNKYKIATLSRGYGRKTKGFLEVRNNDDVTKVGDEPLQFKRKYPEITVAVCEDRVEGVNKLKNSHNLLILDDAYQHRALKPGFSILLLEYKSLFQPKFLLPAGDFRDTFNQRKRADLIVISKSPQSLSESEKQKALKRVNVSLNKRVLFSYLKYGQPYWLNSKDYRINNQNLKLDEDHAVLLVTGIANPQPLVNYLKTQVKKVYLFNYPDHHNFTKQDIRKISIKFDSINEQNKLIVTTEKDAQRLQTVSLSSLVQPMPFAVVPIETAFNDADEKVITEEILSYCKSMIK
jgi:tetraacyldisaccharide 4'-kinase